MKKLIFIISLVALTVGCASPETEVVRNGMYEGSRQIREEHLAWARQLATTQPVLPHLTANDLRLREELHKEFDAFNDKAKGGLITRP